MKSFINRDGCIGCTLCADICPDVFRMADDGLAEVYVDRVPEEPEICAKDAEDNCPVSVKAIL